MYKKLHTHFVGIGGIGMSGIAEVLVNIGYPVTGSDIKKSSTVTRLKKLGVKVQIGHGEKNIEGSDVVVVSSAIQGKNPEVLAALKMGIPVIQRAEMLAELMRLTKYGIAVAGTHGKTTTTSLLAAILHAGKLDPTVVIGGKVKGLRSNAKLGKGDFMVTEADESDGSFLKLLPAIAIVTNIDAEHLDHYGSFDRCREAFYEFCRRLPFFGVAILCGEHTETVALAKRLDKRFQLYGFSKKHDWNAQNIEFQGVKTHFDLCHLDRFVGRIELNLAGLHNVLNSLAAIAVAHEIGMSFKNCARALRTFKGVGRRMEVLFKGKDIVAIDDYGHHPEEIRATLKAIHCAYVGRLVVLFQPHRYSRTRDLFKDFVNSFDLADQLFVLGIYPAGETPLKGVSGQRLALAIEKRQKGKVKYLPHTQDLVQQVVKVLRPGDVFLSLGAGDVTHTAQRVTKELKKKYE